MEEKKKLILFFIFIAIIAGLSIFIAYHAPFFNRQQSEGGVDKQEEQSGKTKPMRVTYLDIGQGDATFIEFPNSEQMLIDCAKNTVIIEALGRVMPFYDREIDYMIITNPDLDHYGGCIDVLKRFHVKRIIHSGFDKKDAKWQAFLSYADAEVSAGAEIIISSATSTWNIGEAVVDILYPDHDIAADPQVPGNTGKISVNNTSVVTKISYGSQGLLFPGDAEAEQEAYLVETYGSLLDVEVVKLGHHCSQSSSIPAFLQATTPEQAVCSSAAGNAYGHPHRRVLRRAERAGASVWRTDLNGDILMTVTKSAIETKPARLP